MRPLRSTSTGGGIGNDFDTSFDASDIIPNLNNGRSASSMDDDDDVVHILQGGKSPLPPSEAQDRLDNSLRYDLKYKRTHPQAWFLSEKNNFRIRFWQLVDFIETFCLALQILRYILVSVDTYIHRAMSKKVSKPAEFPKIKGFQNKVSKWGNIFFILIHTFR